MRRISIFLVAVLALSCAKTQEEPVAPPTDGRGTVLKASLSPLTKTAIDGVMVSWTEGDAICVNGQESAPITQGGASAQFAFESSLDAPYEAVYPASLFKDATTVTLPAIWNPFQVPLYGYLESGDMIGFHSLACIIKLSVTADTETTLSSVVFKPLGGEQVSGDFTIDYATGTLTPTSSADSDKSVKVIVGQAMSATPLTVYLPVPPGEYPYGYDIEFVSAENTVMRRRVDPRTLVAGQLRSMPQLSFVPNVSPEYLGGIGSAADFIEFASAVNAGESTAKWENEDGWVTLLGDIDFAGVENWTPVGDVTAPWDSYNPSLPDGQHAFTGKFDGNSHHIKNLALVDNGTVDGRHFGLFGYVGPGGIVQNFVIEENCSLTVTSAVSHSTGLIAGVLYDATVRDVTSYAPMTYTGAASGYFHMALIGGIYANTIGCTVDSVHNYGDIEAQNTANLNAGATGLHVAGIVGFTNAATASVVVSSCNNYGDMTSQAGRTAGIVGAANKNTTIIGCENHGDQLNTMNKNDGGRLGNICCMTNNGSVITSCKNYGDLISTTAARVGGIVSLPNAGEYSGNENYGEIISDSQYRGVLFGYLNTAVAWEGGIASGKVGTYNNGEYSYDVYSEADKLKYLGKDGSSGKATYNNVVIDIASGDTPDPSIDVDADFRIFFIGNSFTKDAVEHLPGILKAAGLDGIQMIHMYYGGHTIPEYNNEWNDSAGYHCYVCNPGESGWTEFTDKTLAQIAATGKWDVVTIQEHTGKRLAWGWTADEKAAIDGLVAKVKAAQETTGGSPKLYYILSQAYHDLSKAQSGEKPFTNTDEMWDVISAQGQKVMEECEFDGIISTGAMLQNLRTTSLNNSNGLTRDGYHMDLGLSRYGASCTVFETVIGPFNGNVNMDGNTYRTSSGTPVTDDNAPIAIAAARAAIEKPFEVTDLSGLTPSVTPAVVSISDVAGLLDFASRVNAGEEAYKKATVTLTSDIDCSSISSWQPIGNCTLSSSWSANALTTDGHVFTGSFDGGNHSIRNLHMDFAPAQASGAWGFFGGLGEGAVVKDLNFDSTCSMNISTGFSGVFGMLAGVVVDATVSNVSTSASISGGGTSSLAYNAAAGRVAVGGLIGWVIANTTNVSLTNLSNAGTIGTAQNGISRGGNGGNGANGFMLGGIVGFSTTGSTSFKVTLANFENDADIYTDAGRVSGILSSANRYTRIENCSNTGDIYYSGNGTFRPGNITCIAGEGSELVGCTNTGDLIAPDCASAAGIVCLVNHASVVINNCHSLGATIVCKGFDTATPKTTYAGALFGYCNSAATFSGCSVSGAVGTAVSDVVALTSDNYFTFVGQATSNCPSATSANITFAQ